MNKFTPPFWLKNPHLQTLGSVLVPRALRTFPSENRRFEMSDGSQLETECSWQKDRHAMSTLIVVHGLNGSTFSSYTRGVSSKAFRRGLNVIRLNLRNAGNGEALSKTLCHAGQSNDLIEVMTELVTKDSLDKIDLIGFSFGGNICLKAAAEWPAQVGAAVKGIVGISPLVDLAAAVEAIDQAPVIYRFQLLRGLKSTLKRRHKLFPGAYDLHRLGAIRTLREFDEEYSKYNGFKNADDYYAQASSLPHLGKITTPTLLIQADDDRVIPAESFRAIKNEQIEVCLTRHGGHGGFISAYKGGDADRHWAENRAIDFFSSHLGPK